MMRKFELLLLLPLWQLLAHVSTAMPLQFGLQFGSAQHRQLANGPPRLHDRTHGSHPPTHTFAGLLAGWTAPSST